MVFVGQSLLQLKLDTKVDLAAQGVSTAVVVYKKPDGTRGEWAATFSGVFVTRDVQVGDIDQAGSWTFQAKVTTTGGRVGLGQVAPLRVAPAL